MQYLNLWPCPPSCSSTPILQPHSTSRPLSSSIFLPAYQALFWLNFHPSSAQNPRSYTSTPSCHHSQLLCSSLSLHQFTCPLFHHLYVEVPDLLEKSAFHCEIWSVLLSNLPGALPGEGGGSIISVHPESPLLFSEGVLPSFVQEPHLETFTLFFAEDPSLTSQRKERTQTGTP